MSEEAESRSSRRERLSDILEEAVAAFREERRSDPPISFPDPQQVERALQTPDGGGVVLSPGDSLVISTPESVSMGSEFVVEYPSRPSAEGVVSRPTIRLRETEDFDEPRATTPEEPRIGYRPVHQPGSSSPVSEIRMSDPELRAVPEGAVEEWLDVTPPTLSPSPGGGIWSGDDLEPRRRARRKSSCTHDSKLRTFVLELQLHNGIESPIAVACMKCGKFLGRITPSGIIQMTNARRLGIELPDRILQKSEVIAMAQKLKLRWAVDPSSDDHG